MTFPVCEHPSPFPDPMSLHRYDDARVATPAAPMATYVLDIAAPVPTDCRVATTPPTIVGARVDIIVAAGVPATIPAAPNPRPPASSAGPTVTAAVPAIVPPTTYAAQQLILPNSLVWSVVLCVISFILITDRIGEAPG